MKKNITLVNLGGIRNPLDIPPFLFNMFNDNNIIHIKQPARFIAALLITLFRSKGAYLIYKKVKSSPIFDISCRQAEKLKKGTNIDVRCMFSYSKPFIKRGNFIYIPLYGFYSHTTHGNILKKVNKVFPPFCIFGEFFDLIEKRIDAALKSVPKEYKTAIVLSAHSLPERLAKKTNDPYRHDLEVFINYLQKRIDAPIYLAFQSKLGHIEWLKPETAQAIKLLAQNHDALIVVPISFISDNTETVYEIDIEYKNLAKKNGIKYFKRIDCFNDDEDFISFLSKYLKEGFK